MTVRGDDNVQARSRAEARSQGRFRVRPSSPADVAGLPGGGSGATDPIDRAHLARYTLGQADLEREILGLFVRQLPLTLESLRFAATDRDWQVAAHTLKGSARAVGAWKVAQLAQSAERLPTLVGVGERDAVLDAIDAAVAEVEVYMAQDFPAEAA